jgi:hypothetical protein
MCLSICIGEMTIGHPQAVWVWVGVQERVLSQLPVPFFVKPLLNRAIQSRVIKALRIQVGCRLIRLYKHSTGKAGQSCWGRGLYD